MEVNNIPALASAMATAENQQAVAVAVAKKALDVQATSAAALLEMLPPVTSPNLPPHLGQHVDTTA